MVYMNIPSGPVLIAEESLIDSCHFRSLKLIKISGFSSAVAVIIMERCFSFLRSLRDNISTMKKSVTPISDNQLSFVTVIHFPCMLVLII